MLEELKVFMGADGPKGCVSSLRARICLGFLVSCSSESTGLSAMESSCMCSMSLPPFSASRMLALKFPLISENR